MLLAIDGEDPRAIFLSQGMAAFLSCSGHSGLIAVIPLPHLQKDTTILGNPRQGHAVTLPFRWPIGNLRFDGSFKSRSLVRWLHLIVIYAF